MGAFAYRGCRFLAFGDLLDFSGVTGFSSLVMYDCEGEPITGSGGRWVVGSSTGAISPLQYSGCIQHTEGDFLDSNFFPNGNTVSNSIRAFETPQLGGCVVISGPKTTRYVTISDAIAAMTPGDTLELGADDLSGGEPCVPVQLQAPGNARGNDCR